MIACVSNAGVLHAIGRARSIVLGASLLGPGRLLNALEAAARRGARVAVRLEGRPYTGGRSRAAEQLAERNARSVLALRAAGADAVEVDASDGDGAPLHLKGAICDGVAYLDDRNWPVSGTDTIVRDTRAGDVAALRAALLQRRAASSRDFWSAKGDALAAETRLLDASRSARQVDVESESFGYGRIYAALERLASAGVRCRVIVDERALTPQAVAALGHLRAAGVRVRAGNATEKMALAGEARAWVGSANATYGNAGQLDWGLRTRARSVVGELRAHFEANWSASKPLRLTA